MAEKTFIAALGAGIISALGIAKNQHSISKRITQVEKDVRTCFGTNRDSYVEKNFCSLQSKTLEEKVNSVVDDVKLLRETQGNIKEMLHDVHIAVCNRKPNQRKED